MEEALKKIIKEKALLLDENKALSLKLQQTMAMSQSTEAQSKKDLLSAYGDLQLLKKEYDRWRDKAISLKKKYLSRCSELRSLQESFLKETEDFRRKETEFLRRNKDLENELALARVVTLRLEKELHSKETLITSLTEELQASRKQIMTEFVPIKEYERLSTQLERLNNQMLDNMVPLDVAIQSQSEVVRLQQLVNESVPKAEYHRLLEEHRGMIEKQMKSFVSRDVFDAVDAELSNLRVTVAKDMVPIASYNELVAIQQRQVRSIEADFVTIKQYAKLETELEAERLERQLIEESARVLEHERDLLMEKLDVKNRELQTVSALCGSHSEEVASLRLVIAEAETTLESLRNDVSFLLDENSRLREQRTECEKSRAGAATQLSDIKIQLRHGGRKIGMLQQALDVKRHETDTYAARLKETETSLALLERRFVELRRGTIRDGRKVASVEDRKGEVTDIFAGDDNDDLDFSHSADGSLPISPPRPSLSLRHSKMI